VEFARQSEDGRLTLVLVPSTIVIRTLWTLFTVDDVQAAREALRRRERIPPNELERHIAVWQVPSQGDSLPPTISAWARSLAIDAVVWTALPPSFSGQKGRVPTLDEAVAHLRHLPHEQRRQAERYVRLAPRQIDTPYRRRFELEFGWAPLSQQ